MFNCDDSSIEDDISLGYTKKSNYYETEKNHTVLSKRGYSLIKDKFSIKEIEKVKLELTVKPFVCSDYGSTSEPFNVYIESKSKLYIPKYIGYSKFGNPDKIKLNKGSLIDIEFYGSLRDKQKVVVESYLKSCTKSHDFTKYSKGGIISVGCGFGKTVLALYIATVLKRKTLVIVHKTFLMNQWKERIQQYIPSAKIGFIQGKTIDVDDKDIVIGMLQSISMKEYDDNVFNDFGFTVIDEAHHIAAEVFSRSLTKINSYYMLGLSATPKRKDGLSKVFEWYIGPYLYIQKKNVPKPLEINIVKFTSENEDYNDEVQNFKGQVCMPKMINNITQYFRRTELIYAIIAKIINENLLRKILVLSDRREHLKMIYNMIENRKLCSVGYYIGGMKEKDLKKSENMQVLLGTYSMSSEGMDIPELNTLIMGSPKSEIEQSVGRILRKDHEDLTPKIFDIVDDFSVFTNQANKRKKFYKKNNYKTVVCKIHDNCKFDVSEYTNMLDNTSIYDSTKNVKKVENDIFDNYLFE